MGEQKITVGLVSVTIEATRSARSAPFLGRNPSKTNRSPPNPDSAIADVTDFDPIGADGEHPEDVGNAVDGEPDTVWTTQQYDTREFGGLKTGVGLLVDLGEAVDVASVRLVVPTPGADVEVHVAEEQPTGAPDGEPAGRRTGVDGDEVTIPTAGTRGRWVTIWFTRLSETQRNGRFVIDVAEVQVRS